MTPLFDSVLMVDWSSAATPRRGADSIWWALHRRDRGPAATGNPATRREAVEILAHLIGTEADLGHRVLVGFDFPLGYPLGTAEALTGAPGWAGLWALLAREIVDGVDNVNNRFAVAAQLNRRFEGAGPFWGRPRGLDLPDLPEKGTARTPRERPAERRLVELAVPQAQSVWKLYTNGSVGGQALVGIPALEHLRADPRLAGRCQIWPFETGLALPTAPVVIAEVYPSLLAAAVARVQRADEPRDRAQVRVAAAVFASLDAAGALAPLFAPRLDAAEAAAVAGEEAWILGAGFEPALLAAAA